MTPMLAATDEDRRAVFLRSVTVKRHIGQRYNRAVRELWTDTWRILKLTAAIVGLPLLIWGALVLLGVLR